VTVAAGFASTVFLVTALICAAGSASCYSIKLV
jgi:hypothetical protein